MPTVSATITTRPMNLFLGRRVGQVYFIQPAPALNQLSGVRIFESDGDLSALQAAALIAWHTLPGRGANFRQSNPGMKLWAWVPEGEINVAITEAN